MATHIEKIDVGVTTHWALVSDQCAIRLVVCTSEEILSDGWATDQLSAVNGAIQTWSATLMNMIDCGNMICTVSPIAALWQSGAYSHEHAHRFGHKRVGKYACGIAYKHTTDKETGKGHWDRCSYISICEELKDVIGIAVESCDDAFTVSMELAEESFSHDVLR